MQAAFPRDQQLYDEGRYLVAAQAYRLMRR